MVLILARPELERLLKMDEVIEAVEEAFVEFSKGTAKMPVRQSIAIPEKEGWLGVMPAYMARVGALGAKVVTVYTGNPQKYNLPTVIASMLLIDPDRGLPTCLMDGTYLTAMRTGATSGVATKYLAREDSGVVGIIGAGGQAMTQIMAVATVRPIRKVKVFDIEGNRAAFLSERLSKRLGLQASSVGSAREAVESSDIVITATTSKKPVLDGDWLPRGAHVNAIGAFAPDARELDTKTISMAKVVVDSLQSVLEEAGDILIPISEGSITREHIHAELGEIVTGRKPGREANEITVFKSCGLAIEDATTALLAYKKARKIGLGVEVPI